MSELLFWFFAVLVVAMPATFGLYLLFQPVDKLIADGQRTIVAFLFRFIPAAGSRRRVLVKIWFRLVGLICIAFSIVVLTLILQQLIG